MQPYIVVVECWIASVSDDRVCVFFEQASDEDGARTQALKDIKEKHNIDQDMIFDVLVYPAVAGEIYMQD